MRAEDQGQEKSWIWVRSAAKRGDQQTHSVDRQKKLKHKILDQQYKQKQALHTLTTAMEVVKVSVDFLVYR